MYAESFVSKLRHARERTGFTQREVSKETGIPHSTIANYETGRTQPDIENLGILIDFYGISADWLLGTKGELEIYRPTKERLVNNDQTVGIPRTRKTAKRVVLKKR